MFSPLSCALLLSVWLACMHTSLACMCSNTHPQLQFCQADFVIRGVPIKTTNKQPSPEFSQQFHEMGLPVPAHKVYTFRVQQIFKGRKNIVEKTGKKITKNSEVSITAAAGGMSCAVKFAIGASYLIAGKIAGTGHGEYNMEVGFCNLQELWRDVSHEMKFGLKENYQCDCHVHTCTSGDCDQQQNPNTCIWHITPSKPIDPCNNYHLSCRRVTIDDRQLLEKKTTSCMWVEGKAYNQCREVNLP